MPLWMGLLTNFQLGLFLYKFLLGIIIQDRDAGYSWLAVLLHMPLSILLVPFAIHLESAAVIYSFVSKTSKFEVIKK